VGQGGSGAHPHPFTRYAEAVDIGPAWTVDVLTDPDRLVDEPDPDRRTSIASASSATRRPREW